MRMSVLKGFALQLFWILCILFTASCHVMFCWDIRSSGSVSGSWFSQWFPVFCNETLTQSAPSLSLNSIVERAIYNWCIDEPISAKLFFPSLWTDRHFLHLESALKPNYVFLFDLKCTARKKKIYFAEAFYSSAIMTASQSSSVCRMRLNLSTGGSGIYRCQRALQEQLWKVVMETFGVTRPNEYTLLWLCDRISSSYRNQRLWGQR